MLNNTVNITKNDFGKICRACLAEGELEPLYNNCSKEECFVEMLMSCTFVQVCFIIIYLKNKLFF